MRTPRTMGDHMTRTCNDCDGAGGYCTTCGEIPDNCDCDDCDCERDAWAECLACGGTGTVEEDD